MGLKQKIKKACKSSPAWAFGPHGPCIFRFGSRLEIESDRDKIGLDCFSSLRTINMYPMLFVKKRTSSRLANNNSRRIATPNSRVSSKKRHAALIASCDQDSIVLAFTLVLLIQKHFWWRVMLVILMFIAWLLVDSSCFDRLSSTNIMLSLCSHVSILC